jgi:hypothetical protein
MDDRTLVTRLCEQLAAASGWAWRPTGPDYTPAEVGVFYGALGPAPDQAVGVTIYDWTDPYPVGPSTRRVQIRHRGARGSLVGADVLAGATFAALHGLARVAGISLATRVLVAPLGADENDRQERADSYLIILDNPEASS